MPSLIVRSACPPFFVLILSATRPSNCYAAIVAHLPLPLSFPFFLVFCFLISEMPLALLVRQLQHPFSFFSFSSNFLYIFSCNFLFFTGREYFYLLVRLDKVVVVAIVVCFLLFAVIEIHKGHWACVRARCSMQWGILSVLSLSLWADTWLSAAIFTTFCTVLFHSVHIIAFSLSPPPSHSAHTHTTPEVCRSIPWQRPSNPHKTHLQLQRGSDCDCESDSSLCLFLLLFSVILWAQI